MNTRILPPAVAELEEAVAYYNQQSAGLGIQLALQFKQALDRISEYPGAWPIFEQPMRRYRLAHFPYGILYHVHGDTILIVGFMHMAMAPTPWRQRIKGSD